MKRLVFLFVMLASSVVFAACGSDAAPTSGGTVQCNCGCEVVYVSAAEGCYRGACDRCAVSPNEAGPDAPRDVATDSPTDAATDGATDASDAAEGG